MTSIAGAELTPAGAAFDAVAESFDARFGEWLSVTAQRAAVRAALLDAFPAGARLLEIGGGTGVDAAWLLARGRSVLLTDAAPAMVRAARAKLGPASAEMLAAEQLDQLATRGENFDGAFSNFAALNCVIDLAPVGEALARLVEPGGKAVLVVFGCCCPGEMVVEGLRGRFGNMFRRRHRGAVPARLSGRHFTVRYHRRRDMVRALSPWFALVRTTGVGIFVPPSAAEPWISAHPRLLALLQRIDRIVAWPLWFFGDHILFAFERRPEVAAP
ncbi:MAG: class SAM-dependent methyltransferase [Sphingomonas bacterium]|uniref:class I SAM-dependent DNA methyltransferase n=1 Tax=Sphingomonas bacterium TaxID=1895847 RepID=UPI00261D854D|nr:methyltransferase domain-containing protein [Sphingomonas bacterium]MDB5710378.1 class SAM-dependent methyltransferase [Sphingomonas bacterium]